MVDFENIDYLKTGNEQQKAAYRTLTAHQIFEKLADFNPILTGTIPINIDISESDLDIICYWKNSDEFAEQLKILFAKEKNFNLREALINEEKTVIANFYLDDFEIEIFGQNIPPRNQNAFKHMLIEHAILLEKGDDFRLEIIKLKQSGIKTEPAFAKLLGLPGDAYETLLKYSAKE